MLLSDFIHGILGVVPAEMLHVSGTGLLKYIFKCLCNLIGLEKNVPRKHWMIYIDVWLEMLNVRECQLEKESLMAQKCAVQSV